MTERVCDYLGTEFQVEERASAKFLRRECVWNVLSISRWLLYLKKSKSKRKYEMRSNEAPGHIGPCQF